MRIIASCTTIPPRIDDGSIFKFVDSMLKQTLRPEQVYIVVPKHWTRFPLTADQYNQYIQRLQGYNPTVTVVQFPIDSPLIKHLGAYRHEVGDTLQFVGDDDNVYHPKLLERMMEGYFDHNAVMQNRYHMVCTGSGGIIHGFVGLMYKVKHLEAMFDGFQLPQQCWADDQLMSIYFHKQGTRIIPSPVHHYSDIYSELQLNEEGWGHEKTGGDEALHKMGDGKSRDNEIRALEHRYKVKFIDTHDIWKGQGIIIDL